MDSLTLTNSEGRRNTLAQLKNDLAKNKQLFSLTGFFKLTKTDNSYSDVYLYRDLQLEEDVRAYLNATTSYDEIISRYNQYDTDVKWTDWPKHYAVRILSGTGPISCGKNIFAFFPEALRLLPKTHEDVFGLEFIDVWENIFKQTIFPCVKRIFDLPTQFKIYQKLELKLSRTIFMAAVFHEMGHRCGPWKVSPHARPGVSLNAHHWGVLGEISTDSLLVAMLKEFPEIALFVTLQRLFWFGRRGTFENPVSGLTNSDNDSWLGSYLWQNLVAKGAIEKSDAKGMLKLNIERLVSVFTGITAEVDELSNHVVDSLDQNQAIQDWMKIRVEWNESFGFIIPKEFRHILELCSDIPEQAHFQSPFSMHEFKHQLAPSYLSKEA